MLNDFLNVAGLAFAMGGSVCFFKTLLSGTLGDDDSPWTIRWYICFMIASFCYAVVAARTHDIFGFLYQSFIFALYLYWWWNSGGGKKTRKRLRESVKKLGRTYRTDLITTLNG